MNIKKLLASTMASVMAMSMCATSAFAADVSSGSTNVTATVTGAYTTGVIQGSCDIDAEKEKSLREKYGFGN